MNSRPEGPLPATEMGLELDDEESFRQALQLVLTVANQQGVDINNTSWKCVSSETEYTWDVEITPVQIGPAN